MKLSQWAKKHGLSYQTGFNLFKKGQLPGKVTQLPSGTILVEDEEDANLNLQTDLFKIIQSLLSLHLGNKLSRSKLHSIQSILENND